MTPASNPSVHLQAFADRRRLADALAQRVAAALTQDIAQSGRASLAVSGGTTPMVFLAALSAQPVAWDCVDVTLVDERWVPESSSRSNAAMVRSLLLQGRARAAHFLPLFTGHARPEEALDLVETLLARFRLPFSAMVLGMGTDGHTASYFPGGDRFAEAVDPLGRRPVLPMNAPGANEPRITLTLPLLLSAGSLTLHIEGEAKRRVFQSALQPTLQPAFQPGPPEDLPIRAVLNHARSLDVVWAP